MNEDFDGEHIDGLDKLADHATWAMEDKVKIREIVGALESYTQSFKGDYYC